MKNNDTSESHTNNSLKTNTAFVQFLGPDVTFYDVKRKEQITAFLDTKIKSLDEDPDRKSITTLIDYLNDIKYFFRCNMIVLDNKIALVVLPSDFKLLLFFIPFVSSIWNDNT